MRFVPYCIKLRVQRGKDCLCTLDFFVAAGMERKNKLVYPGKS